MLKIKASAINEHNRATVKMTRFDVKIKAFKCFDSALITPKNNKDVTMKNATRTPKNGAA